MKENHFFLQLNELIKFCSSSIIFFLEQGIFLDELFGNFNEILLSETSKEAI